MSRKRKGRYQDSESWWLNSRTYQDYVQRLTEIGLNTFEWKNLPDSVDARYLEMELFYKGYLAYFRDELAGDLAMSCTIGGRLDVYRIPIDRVAFASNGYRVNLTAQDSVLIFNNRLHTPTSFTVELFARRLTEIERAIDVNVKGQKFPIMVLSPESQRLTLQNMMMQYDGNQPFIFADDRVDPESFKVLATGSPFVSDQLNALKHSIWNEAMTFLGVENGNQEKKERLVADEIGGNMGSVEASRWCMLNARRDAANEINRMFGTQIEVGYNSGLMTMVNVATSIRDSVLMANVEEQEKEVGDGE